MTVELSGHYTYGRLLRTMLPMVATMIVTSVYSIVDGLFISNFAGSTAFAAMNIVWPVIALISSIGLMFGSGGSALVSKTLGEGNRERANSIFSMIMGLCLSVGVILGVVVFLFMRPLVLALGAEGEMVDLAVMYGRIVIVAIPSYMLQMAFQPFFMVAEKPQLGTVLSVACGVINMGLDALFVAVFKWGLAGAAIATALSLAFSGMYPLWWFMSPRNLTQIKLCRTRIERGPIRQSCTNGASEFVGSIAMSVVSICYNLQLMKYLGEDGVSAYGILMYVGFIFSAVFIGYNTGVSQVVAYNYGARNRDELRSLLHKSHAILLFEGIILCALSELLAPVLARMFVGYDEGLTALCTHAIRLYMLSFAICGVNMFTSAWFTALNNGIISAVAAFTRTLVFEMAFVFVLPLFLGVDGIWLAVNAAEIFSMLLTIVLLRMFRKKYWGPLPPSDVKSL